MPSTIHQPVAEYLLISAQPTCIVETAVLSRPQSLEIVTIYAGGRSTMVHLLDVASKTVQLSRIRVEGVLWTICCPCQLLSSVPSPCLNTSSLNKLELVEGINRVCCDTIAEKRPFKSCEDAHMKTGILMKILKTLCRGNAFTKARLAVASFESYPQPTLGHRRHVGEPSASWSGNGHL
ncbi:hypothetical protein GQ600_20916 [Phytophthora cactorum]|nr:hypothetical protein GQ600_20916 [Phytophthora cactorum]